MEKIKCNITLREYITSYWLPRKAHELKISTYTRYVGLSQRIIECLGSCELRQLTVYSVYEFYDNLHESKSEHETFTPNEQCIRLLKTHYTRPQTCRAGIGMGTVDALRAGKDVSKNTARKISKLLKLELPELFRENEVYLSERTILHYHRLLYAIIKDSVYDGVIPDNFMAKVRAPRLLGEDEARFLDKREASQVINELRKNGKYPYSEILQLIIYTGLRRGEACGLEWSDINFQTRTLIVRRTSYYLPSEGIYTDTPKTKQSKRTLAFNSKVGEILRSIQIRQHKDSKNAGTLWNNSDRLFTDKNGNPINPSSVTKYFHKFVQEHNLPSCTVHTLRHTNASLMIAAQTPITTVAGRLGHSNPEVTLRIYAHQLSDENIKAAAAIESLI